MTVLIGSSATKVMTTDDNLAACNFTAQLTGVLDHKAVIGVNHPCLLTLLVISKLRMNFLIRCRPLKRPPVSLRLKANKLYMHKNSYAQVASTAETSLLDGEISEKKKELRELTKVRNLSDPSYLEPVNEVRIRTVQSNLAKKYNHLLEESNTKWSEWPNKSPSKGQVIDTSSTPILSKKRLQNRKKRERRSLKMFNQTVEQAKSNGTIINLSDLEIPDECYALLSKRKGFVPTNKHKSLDSRSDCYKTMSKLTCVTSRKMKEQEELAKYDQVNDEDEEMNPHEFLPKSLRRNCDVAPIKTGDKVVDELTVEIGKKIDSLKPSTPISNLDKSVDLYIQ